MKKPSGLLGPLKLRLLAVALVALLPLAAVALWNIDRLAKAQRAELERSATETVRALLIAVDAELNTSIAALQVLGSSPLLLTGDMQGFAPTAQAALAQREAWEAVVVQDAYGQQLLNLNFPGQTRLPRASDPQTFDLIRAAKRPRVSDVILRPLIKDKRYAVRVPVLVDNEVKYVLTAGHKPGVLQSVLDRQAFPAESVAAIVDRNGNIVARSRGGPELMGQPVSTTLRNLLSAGRDGFGLTTTLEGSEVYTAYVRSPVTGWWVAMGIPKAAVDAPVMRSYALLAITLAVSLVLGLLAAFIVSRTIARPIAELGQLARAVREGRRLPKPRTVIPEIAQTVEALDNAQAEREQLLAREHEQREHAEQMNRAKDEFLAMLGHELRNPLAAITSAAEVASQVATQGARQAGGESPAATHRAIAIIQRQSRHLARLLDDLLDVGRVISGKVRLEYTTFDWGALLARSVEAVRANRQGNAPAIIAHLPSLWIRGDASRMEQVADNLLNNACKYTPPSGEIRIELSEEGHEAVLSVRDNGVGISPALLPRVFDLFVQDARTLERAEGGLGIGLTLVKRLVESHGGSVTARSEGVDRGSEFRVRMPLAAAHAVEACGAEGSLLPALSILVVDDNDDARDMLAALLSRQGHQVRSASDGLQGIALALEMKPQLAIVDIGLPGADGYEVARRLRQALGSQIRLIALSGYGLREDAAKAAEAGFDRHLVKPADEAVLRRVIGELWVGR